MFSATWRWIKRLCRRYSECLGAAIDDGDVRSILLYLLFGALGVAGTGGLIFLLTFLIVAARKFIFTWILLPALVLYLIAYLASAAKETNVTNELPDPIEEELVRQRAREQSDDMLALMFYATQDTASTTPLLRPREMFDIQTNAPHGDHFYLERGNVIFQFECDLETAVDKNIEDVIQRELQRHVVKQCARFPMLRSTEAQGRAPVEILDVKNLGGHVLIDCCLTTAATIPLIEARRRARAERKHRQQAFLDQDYPE